MRHGHAALRQGSGNQQGAVAFERLFFGTHEGKTAILGVANDAPDAVIERVGVRDPFVLDSPVGVVARAVGRPAAKCFSQERIADSHVLQDAVQRLMVEMGNIAAVGSRTHVGHFLHVMPLQKFDERFRRMVGMTYREHRTLSNGHDTFSPSGFHDGGDEFVSIAVVKRFGGEAYGEKTFSD